MDRYIAKCKRTLEKWGAPLDNWHCTNLIDEEQPSFVCELCGCEKVRYVHVMEHEQYFEGIYVGCICAGVMEGNMIAARERDREMKNRAKRKLNFPRRKWRKTRMGSYFLNYRGRNVFIDYNGKNYSCYCNGKRASQYKNKPIDNFISACYAAFDIADPISEVIV